VLPGCAASGYHWKRTASSIHAAYVSFLLHLRIDTLGQLRMAIAGCLLAKQWGVGQPELRMPGRSVTAVGNALRLRAIAVD
jgi:hypothetical protein